MIAATQAAFRKEIEDILGPPIPSGRKPRELIREMRDGRHRIASDHVTMSWLFSWMPGSGSRPEPTSRSSCVRANWSLDTAPVGALDLTLYEVANAVGAERARHDEVGMCRLIAGRAPSCDAMVRIDAE